MFNIGNLTAGRDVNIEVGNTTYNGNTVCSGPLKGLELPENTSKETKEAVSELNKGIEKKDPSLIKKSLSLLESAAPRIISEIFTFFILHPFK